MDQTCGKGSRLRRALPFALAGVGVYAVVAYGSAMFNGTPAHLVSERLTPANQVISSADPLPASAPVQLPSQAPLGHAAGQVQSAGRDVLPGDAASVTRSLNSATTGALPSGSASSATTGTNPTAPPGGLNSLLNNIPITNVANLPLTSPAGLTGSSLPVSTKNIAGLGGAQLPTLNGTPLGGLLP